MGRAIAVHRRCRRHPAATVYVVVVAAHIARPVHHPREGVVRRHIPPYRWHMHRGVEPQVLGRIVHPSRAVQPHTLQVERHIDLVARVGIVPVDPYLVVRRIHALHPYLVD